MNSELLYILRLDDVNSQILIWSKTIVFSFIMWQNTDRIELLTWWGVAVQFRSNNRSLYAVPDSAISFGSDQPMPP